MRLLKEELGVPKNIIDLAIYSFNEIIDKIPSNYTVDELNRLELSIKHKFTISDFEFEELIVSFNIEDGTKLIFVGMSVEFETKLSSEYKLLSVPASSYNLGFDFVAPKNTISDDIKNLLIKDKKNTIGNIAHELKHIYDSYKKREKSIKTKSKYLVGANQSFGNINAFNKFMFLIYYCSITESLVRPTEIAALLQIGEIDKKNFYKFLTETRTHKYLMMLKNYTFNQLKSEMKHELPKIKQFFDYLKIDYKNMSEEEIIEKSLEIIYNQIVDWQSGFFKEGLITDIFERLIGIDSQKQLFYDNFVKDISKYKKNYHKFFEKEINTFNIVGNKMLRKIAKLYSLINNK